MTVILTNEGIPMQGKAARYAIVRTNAETKEAEFIDVAGTMNAAAKTINKNPKFFGSQKRRWINSRHAISGKWVWSIIPNKVED
jgi:hypothetical protein